jgi:transposase
MRETTLRTEDNAVLRVLYMALELAAKQWRVVFGDGDRRRRVCIDAGDLVGLSEAMAKAKSHFGLTAQCAVYSCFEAGRDGFWLHRALLSVGVNNVVVDASSIAQPRRGRRAKTDRLDAEQLLNNLLRHVGGERDVWKVVQVPSEADEDARRLHRERERLVKERGAHSTRLRSLLATQGLCLRPGRDFVERLEEARGWDNEALGETLLQELRREYERLVLVRRQLRELEGERKELLASADSRSMRMVVQLMRLAGVGRTSAWVFVMEFFGWRDFRNRREVGALAGLTGTPYDSGSGQREQGISKAGNRRVRALAIEIAWLWLRYQPDSALSRWYMERFAGAGPRARRIGIVALARRLLVALWRWVQFDELPEGARLTAG